MILNRFIPSKKRACQHGFLLTVIFLFSLAQISMAQQKAEPGKAQRAVGRELIVKFRADATDEQIESVLREGKLKVKRHLQTNPMAERKHPGLTLAESDLGAANAKAKLKNHPGIEYVEENHVYRHYAVSNDPYVTSNYTWGLYGDLSSPANTYGSQAAEAWANGYTGLNSVVVAVIDEGIDISHVDLASNIWTNPLEAIDGIDNDGNGYVDDVYGWDFYSETSSVFDPSGDTHGTHVAGTIGAKGGNGTGVAGVNWNVSIISGKFLGADGGTSFDAVEAIDYFVDLKLRHKINLVAINASWGGPDYSRSMHDAVIRAAKAGILFIAAAGNETLNNDAVPAYPANFNTRVGTSTETAASYDAVVAVAAIERTGVLASFSNYGATQVDIGAPGSNILSTYPGNNYRYMAGTSMATPHVTGAVALYASTHPSATPQNIRDAILGSVLPTPALVGKTVTAGRLNLSTIINPTAGAPTSVSGTPGDGKVTLSWNAVNGAQSYVVKRSLTSGGSSVIVGTNITGLQFIDTGLVNGTKYYYAVASVHQGVSGAFSTEVAATPIALPVVTIAATDSQAGEPAATGTFTFSRTGPTTSALTANISVSGTATSGADYASLGTTVVFPIGSASVTRTLTPVDDSVIEGNETVVVTVSSGAGYLVGSPSAGTVTIQDNDSAPADLLVNNSDGAAQVTIVGSWTIAKASSSFLGDYLQDGNTGKGTKSVTFTPTVGAAGKYEVFIWYRSGSTRASNVPVDILHSLGTSTVILNQRINGSSWVSLGTYNFTAGTTGKVQIRTTGTDGTVIADAIQLAPSPALPSVSVLATDASAAEPTSVGKFTFTRTGSTTTSLTVNLAVTGTATSGVDFASLGTTVVFPVGASSVVKTVTPMNDLVKEGNETVIVTVASGAGYTAWAPSVGTVTIVDND